MAERENIHYKYTDTEMTVLTKDISKNSKIYENITTKEELKANIQVHTK